MNIRRYVCRSQWPRGLRRRSASVRLLRLWVRIPAGSWLSVCCECCVLSGWCLCDGLITFPEESYRLWCVVICDLDTSWMRRPWPTGGCCANWRRTAWSDWQKPQSNSQPPGSNSNTGSLWIRSAKSHPWHSEFNKIVLPFYMALEIGYTKYLTWIQHGVSPTVCVCVCVRARVSFVWIPQQRPFLLVWLSDWSVRNRL